MSIINYQLSINEISIYCTHSGFLMPSKAGTVFVETEVKNYGKTAETVEVVNKFSNADGKQVFRLTEKVTLQPGERKVVKQQSPVQNPVGVDRA